MSAVIVGVGSNLGAREAAIRTACELLAARDSISVECVSPIYETEPLGPPQGRYLNAALRLETASTPPEVLRALLRTERRLGRNRRVGRRWGPRSIDLDLLWDERGAYDSPELHVPHPELAQRDFALVPLLDVAPELRDLYGAALKRVGGALEPWPGESIVRLRSLEGEIEVEVEADSLADACALCASFPVVTDRPWSTRHVTLEGCPEGFAEALRDVFRIGFSVRRTTISHCSETQWTVQFHGRNTGLSRDVDVRLVTTLGSRRAVRARLTVAPAVFPSAF